MAGYKGMVDFESSSLWPGTALVDWMQAPRAAFDAWLAGQVVEASRTRQFRATSIATYRAHFSVWLNYLERRHCTLLEATATEAAEFFAAHPTLDPISRRRYLKLWDRVYRSLRRLGWEGANPMTPELKREGLLEVALPEGLSDAELDQLREAVARLPGWRGMRDRALLALLAGAGLRANEVLALPVSAVNPDFSVEIRPQGVHRAHRSIILPGAWREDWLAWALARSRLGVPGVLAFPAAKNGKPYTDSGLFRRIDTWLDQAGLQCEARGANLLRNTFARLALARYSPEEVQEFMGHEELRATLRHAPGSAQKQPSNPQPFR